MINPSNDSFAWATRLDCPPSACNESTKKVLSKGIVSLIWDHVADKLYPVSEVLETRKNILLYKLDENCVDASIQAVKSRAKLKSERQVLHEYIIKAEAQREKQEFSLRVKRQQVLQIKSTRQLARAKKEIFSLKHSQMQSQVQDCNQMRKVCQCVMPSVGDMVDEKTVEESLTLVSSMSSRADRKQVWKKISDTLFPVATPVLWNILLRTRTVDTDRIIQLGSEISSNGTPSHCVRKFDIGIAKACSLHVTAVMKRLLLEAKVNAHNQTIMEYIDKIENHQPNGIDITEWLELTLEVRKWEAQQVGFQKKIDEINGTSEIQTELNMKLSSIAAAIQTIDSQIVQCAQDIQTSVALLKGAGANLNCTKEKLLNALHKFAVLRTESRSNNWWDIDLENELDNFYNKIDMNALRKIALGGEVGEYRHARFCMSQAALATSAPLDPDCVYDFPFISAPLHHLLDCYKILAKLTVISNGRPYPQHPDLQLNSPNDIEEQWYSMSVQNQVHALLELLDLIDQTSETTGESLQLFDVTFDAWSHQIVKEVLTDQSVDGITFKEWQHRFNNLAMILASKTKTFKQSGDIKVRMKNDFQ